MSRHSTLAATGWLSVLVLAGWVNPYGTALGLILSAPALLNTSPTSAGGLMILLGWYGRRVILFSVYLSITVGSLLGVAVIVTANPCLTAGVACVAFLAGLSYFAHSLRPKGDAFGSAEWAGRSDLRRAGLDSPTGLTLACGEPSRANPVAFLAELSAVPLGDPLWPRLPAAVTFARAGTFRPIRTEDYLSTLIVASAGSGKSHKWVIRNALTLDENSVFIDPKGEIFLHSWLARLKMGREIFLIDPWGVTGHPTSRFDPLGVIDPSGGRFLDQVRAFAEAVIVKALGAKEPHWDESAEVLCRLCVVYVKLFMPENEQNLASVRRVAADPELLSKAIRALKGAPYLLGGAARDLALTVENYHPKEFSSVKSVFFRNFDFVDSTFVCESTSALDFDPRRLGRVKVDVFFVIPPELVRAFGRLVRLWLSTVIAALPRGAHRKHRKRVLIYADEAGNLGALPALSDAILMMRSYGARVVLALQSLGQLERLFPDAGGAKSALANFHSSVFFGINDYDSARLISDMCGQSTVEVTSSSVQQDPRRRDRDTTSTSTSQTGRPLIAPDEVLRLGSDRAIVFHKGCHKPILARVRGWYEDPPLAALARESLYAEPEQGVAGEVGDDAEATAEDGRGTYRCPYSDCESPIEVALAGLRGRTQADCPACGRSHVPPAV